MYINGELVVKSYMPLKLEEGMLFIKGHHVNTEKEFMEIWALERVPLNPEEFMLENGAPIELSIIDEEDVVLASHEEIAWLSYPFDEETLHDLTLKDINIIFNEFGGFLELEIEEDPEDESYNIVVFEEKVIVRFPQEYDEEEEEYIND
jgi:hypothetical protein